MKHFSFSSWRKALRLLLWLTLTVALTLHCTYDADPMAGTISETETGMYGQLVDGRTGTSAKGARVSLYRGCADSARTTMLPDSDEGKDFVAYAGTDAEGEYWFTDISSGSYRIYGVLIDENETLTVHIPCVLLEDRETLYVGIDTLLPPGAIQGKALVDSMPYSGVRCDIPGLSSVAFTCDSGKFLLSGLYPGRYTVRFSHPKLYDTTAQPILVRTQDTVSLEPVVMRKNPASFPGNISGRIVDDAGRPVAEAIIVIDSTGAPCLSDSSGEFYLHDIRPGVHELLISRMHYQSVRIESVTVEMGQEVSGIKCALVRDPEYWPATISGRIFDDRDSALPNAIVSVDSLNLVSVTDSSGFFRLTGVVAGSYRIHVAHAYFHAVFFDSVRCGISDTIDNFTVTLTRNSRFFPGCMRGVVIDESGEDIAGALVTLDSAAGACVTDSAGRFAFSNVAPGEHKLAASHARYHSAKRDSLVIGLEDTVTGIELVMAKSAAGFPGEIYGTIADGDGAPVEGALVRLDTSSVVVPADANGAFVIPEASPGMHTLYITHPKYHRARVDSIVTVMDERTNVGAVTIEKTTEGFPGSVSGAVLSADSGAPISGAAVHIEPAGFVTKTNAQGEYAFSALVEGEYTIAFSHEKYFAHDTEGIVLKVDQHLENINASLEKNPACFFGSVEGHVVHAITGSPLVHAEVTIPSKALTAVADSAGRYIFPSVSLGRCTITAGGQYALDYSVSNDVTENQTTVADTLYALDLNEPARVMCTSDRYNYLGGNIWYYHEGIFAPLIGLAFDIEGGARSVHGDSVSGWCVGDRESIWAETLNFGWINPFTKSYEEPLLLGAIDIASESHDPTNAYLVRRRDYTLMRVNMQSQSFDSITCGALRVDVGCDGVPWYVDTAHAVYRLVNETPERIGECAAIDVGCGRNLVYAVGVDSCLYRYDENAFVKSDTYPCFAVDVDFKGGVWIIMTSQNGTRKVYRKDRGEPAFRMVPGVGGNVWDVGS